MSDLKTPDEENPMVKLITGFIGEGNLKAYQEGRLAGKEKEAMEERIRDDARQFLQDEKSFPQPLPKIVIDTIVEEAPEVVFSRNRRTQGKTTDIGDMTGAPGFREDPSLADIIADQRTIERKPEMLSYEVWKDMTKEERKEVGLDLPLVAIQNRVRSGSIPLPRGYSLPTKLLMDEPSGMTAPAADSTPITPKPDGLMARGTSSVMSGVPASEVSVPRQRDTESMSSLASLRDTFSRVHGKKSKALKELERVIQQAQSGTPIQYTDINQLLRRTKSLRKTATRDKLIEQLAILANEARK
jgi:hypothetical protein